MKTDDPSSKDTAGVPWGSPEIKVDLELIQNRIRDRPLFYVTIAAGMGFVAGGGLASRWGLVLLGLAGRRAAVETATNFGRQMVRQTAKRGAASA